VTLIIGALYLIVRYDVQENSQKHDSHLTGSLSSSLGTKNRFDAADSGEDFDDAIAKVKEEK
jgi:hypothetical protein